MQKSLRGLANSCTIDTMMIHETRDAKCLQGRYAVLPWINATQPAFGQSL